MAFQRPEAERLEWETYLASLPPKPVKKKPPKKRKKPKKRAPMPPTSLVRDLYTVCQMFDQAARAHGLPVDQPGGILSYETQLRKVIHLYRIRQQKLAKERKPLIVLPDGHFVPPIQEARNAGQYPPKQ